MASNGSAFGSHPRFSPAAHARTFRPSWGQAMHFRSRVCGPAKAATEDGCITPAQGQGTGTGGVRANGTEGRTTGVARGPLGESTVGPPHQYDPYKRLPIESIPGTISYNLQSRTLGERRDDGACQTLTSVSRRIWGKKPVATCHVFVCVLVLFREQFPGLTGLDTSGRVPG
ncbi:hypothetical protein BD311DRAFT_741949 [Dichomitus squalens]|uniref:Uncharacterized protein n=1 Tax=Dichomitus squalens TaxID=114155 RepID=A0A4Q9MAM4_9APHY|nr:hypothetical protein BD311DRAFT_741949 [Dichomitus squalens]